jgi:phosphotriesterase-related protein
LSTIGDQTSRRERRSPPETKLVWTVSGPVAPADLGVTLVHEHLLLDGDCFFELSADADAEAFAQWPVTPDIIERVRAASCSNRDNLALDDLDLAVSELAEFVQLGGRTVVDVTSSVGLGRDPSGLRDVGRRTGANVVMGCGFYCEYSHPDFIASADVDALAALIHRELTEGVEGIRAGVIGEIGINGQERGTLRYVGEMTSSEERALRAACGASLETGAAVIVHQPNRSTVVPEIFSVLESEGVSPDRVVLGHMSSVPDFTMHIEALERGFWIAYDNFGMVVENQWHRPVEDGQRIEWLLDVVRRGYREQLLVSHDVWCKVQLRRFGGGGYAHILRTIVPELRERGLSEDDVEQLLVRNPAEVLAF